MADLDRTQIEQTLGRIIDFLENYLPLANAHVADFLIADSWNKLVPQEIQADLLKLSEAELARLPSCALYNKSDAISPKETSANSAESESAIAAKSFSDTSSQPSKRDLWDRSKLPVWHHKELRTFVLEAQSFTLPQLGSLTNIKDLMESWKIGDNSRTTIRQFMSEKKSHEVDMMADVCSTLAAAKGINSVSFFCQYI